MISMLSHFPDVFDSSMANNRNAHVEPWLIKIAGGVISLLLLMVLGLIGVVWNDFSDKLKSVETTITAMNIAQNNHGQSLARMEERTKSLERSVYKTKAVSLGFKNPEIVRASLGTNVEFESKTASRSGEYFIKYTILSYDPISNMLKLRFDAALPNGAKYYDNTLIMRIRDGEVVELTQFFFKDAPTKIYLQVIETPVRDQAILAIGPKQEEPGKVS